MPPSRPCPALSCRKSDDADAASIFGMPPSKPSAAALGGLAGGAGLTEGNGGGEFRKIGGGVTQAEAGIFSWENGFGGRKTGACHAIAPARLAGMSDQ
jgi:hypothetical protein